VFHFLFSSQNWPILLSDGFDPFDLSQMELPKTFRTLDYTTEKASKFDPYEGFRESMQQLGNDMKRGLEIYVNRKQ